MSYGRMEEAERKLIAEIAALLAEAQRVDAAEDARYGKGKRGTSCQTELARRESRLAKIREAKAALEAEAQAQATAAAAAAQAKLAERERQAQATGRKPTGRPPQLFRSDPGKTEAEGATELHGPESRIMKDGPARALCKPTMPRQRWMGRPKSSWRRRSPRRPTTSGSWSRCWPR